MIVQACLTLPDLAHEQNPSQLHTSAITPRTGLHTHTHSHLLNPSKMSEIKKRETPKAEKSNTSAAPAPIATDSPIKFDEKKIKPDRVFVFSKKDKHSTDASLERDVQESARLVGKAGFYVSFRKGISGSVLILVRATPKLVSEGARKGWSRAVTVQTALPLDSLQKLENGPSDEFLVDNLVGTKRSFPGFFGLILKPAALNEIERVYGSFTAGVFELAGFLTVYMLIFSVFAISVSFLPNLPTTVDGQTALLAAVPTVALWLVFQSKYAVPSASTITTTPPGDAPTGATPSDDTTASSTPSKATTTKASEKETKEAKKKNLSQANRRLLFLPISFVILTVFSAGLFLVFLLEITCTQLYAGKYAPIVGLIPTGANVVYSIIFSMLYSMFVELYVSWEGYTNEAEKVETISQRTFYLNALTSYLPLVFTAFFYIPFGELAARYTLIQFKNYSVPSYIPLTPVFTLNTERLRSQATFFTATQHIIQLFMTTFLPLGITWLKRSVFKQAEPAGNNRFALEQLWAPFSPNAFASSLIIALGYVLFLAAVWPLGVVFSFVGLWVRTRGALYMLTSATRLPAVAVSISRPRSRNLGIWNTNLKSLVVLSAIFTPAMSVVYSKLGDSVSFTSSKLWLHAVGWSLLVENIVLVYFHVLEQYFSQVVSVKPPLSGEQFIQGYIDNDQDEMWEAFDVQSELQYAFKK